MKNQETISSLTAVNSTMNFSTEKIPCHDNDKLIKKHYT